MHPIHKVLFPILFCLSLNFTSEAGLNPFQKHRRSGEENVQLLIKKMKDMDPEIQKFFDESVGWAVFPKITKAGLGIGGASGNGRVYQKNQFIGTSKLSQFSVGLQLGGQQYGEIIFFQNPSALDHFKGGKFKVGASLSAIAFKTGAAREAHYTDGLLIMVIPSGGLMYEATISGQNFTFREDRKKR